MIVFEKELLILNIPNVLQSSQSESESHVQDGRLQVSIQSCASGKRRSWENMFGATIHSGNVSSGTGGHHWRGFHDQNSRNRRRKNQGKLL